jgi:hypothetical protein
MIPRTTYQEPGTVRDMPTTWGEILTGDVILGADKLAWYVTRDGRTYTLTHPDRGTPIHGTPQPALPVTRLIDGPATHIRAVLAAAGLTTDIIFERTQR